MADSKQANARGIIIDILSLLLLLNEGEENRRLARALKVNQKWAVQFKILMRNDSIKWIPLAKSGHFFVFAQLDVTKR